MVSIVRTG